MLRLNLKNNLKIKNLYFVDFSGKLVKPKSINKVNFGYNIDVSNLSNGIYILEIFTDNNNNRIKVIIEK